VLAEQQHFRFTDVVKHYSNLTMKQALKSNSPSIGQISTGNEATAVKCIENLFTGLSAYFDKPLLPTQSNAIATELLSFYEYRSLKLEDLVVICQDLKKADIYKLTLAKILQAVSKYTDDRQRLAMNTSRSDSKHHSSQKDIMNTTVLDRLNKAYYHIPASKKK
jgi:hypothetical protein